jgi:hypothetical protein
LELLFKNTAWADIGNAGGLQPSSAAGNFYVALFSVAPTDTTQGTECNYTGYARVAVVRSGSGWTVATANNSNAAAITFGACSAGPQTAVAWAICKAGTAGVNDQIIWGDLDPTYSITVPNAPEFAIGDLDVNFT